MDPLDSSDSSSLRGRASKMAPPAAAAASSDTLPPIRLEIDNPADPSPSSSRPHSPSPPWLPTRTEQAALVLFPAILVFGALFALLSPTVRAAPYDHYLQAHVQDPALAPSYFARKANLFNTLFVKRGWAWVTGSFVAFVATHPAFLAARADEGMGVGRVRAVLRWAMVTGWWFVVTQWCFGPALIDRGFRWTGGKCEAAIEKLEMSADPVPDLDTVVSALACKTVGGRWSGGHDISGHVFLLVLGIGFLAQEVGWALGVAWGGEERRVLMADGSVSHAGVEREKREKREQEKESESERKSSERSLGMGGKAVLVVLGLSVWMLLMTAIYFHTWVEKFTGLLAALIGLYVVYVVPRFVPVLRGVVGLPGL
jgi:hypothetical protein